MSGEWLRTVPEKDRKDSQLQGFEKFKREMGVEGYYISEIVPIEGGGCVPVFKRKRVQEALHVHFSETEVIVSASYVGNGLSESAKQLLEGAGLDRKLMTEETGYTGPVMGVWEQL